MAIAHVEPCSLPLQNKTTKNRKTFVYKMRHKSAPDCAAAFTMVVCAHHRGQSYWVLCLGPSMEMLKFWQKENLLLFGLLNPKEKYIQHIK